MATICDSGIWTITSPTACIVDANFNFIPAGLQVTFIDTTSFGSGTTALTYLWNFGDTNTSTDVSTVHTYTANGTYTVTLTVTAQFTDNSLCQDTVTKSVSVNVDNLCFGTQLLTT